MRWLNEPGLWGPTPPPSWPWAAESGPGQHHSALWTPWVMNPNIRLPRASTQIGKCLLRSCCEGGKKKPAKNQSSWFQTQLRNQSFEGFHMTVSSAPMPWGLDPIRTGSPSEGPMWSGPHCTRSPVTTGHPHPPLPRSLSISSPIDSSTHSFLSSFWCLLRTQGRLLWKRNKYLWCIIYLPKPPTCGKQ